MITVLAGTVVLGFVLPRGRPVVAMTATTAAIQNPTGALTIYRKLNKPGLGPVGDSLDDFE